MQKILHRPVITDNEYRQRIRRYKPSSLLPLIAATAARFSTQQDWLQSPYRKYLPWALADVARVSLTHGTEFDRSDATPLDLLKILDLHSDLFDPLVQAEDEDLAAALPRFMHRAVGQQLVWQVNEYSMLARTAAVLSQRSAKKLTCIVDGWDNQLLGCSLAEYVGTAQLLCWGWNLRLNAWLTISVGRHTGVPGLREAEQALTAAGGTYTPCMCQRCLNAAPESGRPLARWPLPFTA